MEEWRGDNVLSRLLALFILGMKNAVPDYSTARERGEYKGIIYPDHSRCLAEMGKLVGRRRPLAPLDNVSINDVCDPCVKPG